MAVPRESVWVRISDDSDALQCRIDTNGEVIKSKGKLKGETIFLDEIRDKDVLTIENGKLFLKGKYGKFGFMRNVIERMNIEYLADHQDVIPTLAQWFYEEWAYLHPERTYSDVECLISERAQKDKIPMALVAFYGEELLGTVSLKVHDMETRIDLSPWLAGLYVSVTRRRQGIGEALVFAIEKKACELGVGRLYLYTPESESFYSKLEWKVKERTEYHGYPVTLMQKEIVL